jgi:transposase-like protein
VRYYLNNLIDDDGHLQKQTEDQFWPYFRSVRAARPELEDIESVFTRPRGEE